ncbi:hypothetical protein DI392_17975 [Vibrio albus]|uniref:NYN domain-containing protein n=1 Tax=Vibrio albus TaxID=2200953 RepID=A0A2U3B549_9VIBR|nr:hypothetical protein [Vibrio albus]PWI31920.1 hypothetical protein DI392_17975 [Vibrio albus]
MNILSYWKHRFNKGNKSVPQSVTCVDDNEGQRSEPVTDSRLLLIDLDNVAGGESDAARSMRNKFPELIELIKDTYFPGESVEIRIYGYLNKHPIAENHQYSLIDTPPVTAAGKTLADENILWDMSQAYRAGRPVALWANDCNYSIHLGHFSQSGLDTVLLINGFGSRVLRDSCPVHHDIRWQLVRGLSIPAEEMARRDLFLANNGLSEEKTQLNYRWVKTLLRTYLIKGWESRISRHDVIKLLRRSLPEFRIDTDQEVITCIKTS